MDNRQMQAALNARGHRPLLILDGIVGPKTLAAIDLALASSGVDFARWGQPRRHLGAVQVILREAGHNPGKIDGLNGPMTRAARSDWAIAQAKSALAAAPVRVAPGQEPAWLTHARQDIGLREAPGAANNPAVVRMFAEAGQPTVLQDAVPWCAAAVGAWLHRAGLKGTGTLWALDYANWGQRLDRPILGAVAAKRRTGGGGHVFLVVGANAATVYGLGGNQGDAVSIASFPRAEILAYRWPTGVEIPAPPLPLPATIAGARAGVSEA